MTAATCLLQVWRPAEGFGIRLDGGNAYPGATITPHYDSMLMKVTASSLTFQSAADKLARALVETRIRGVRTNSPFILNVLRHPAFLAGQVSGAAVPPHRVSRRRVSTPSPPRLPTLPRGAGDHLLHRGRERCPL